MELEQQMFRGARAKEVLDNEEFHRAFELIEKELTESWKSSPAKAEADREKLYLLMKLLDKLKVCLQTTLETGKMAEIELNHKRSLVDRLKETWQSPEHY